MANIYLDPLDSLRYEDLTNWATQDPKPKEGERLEFKKDYAASVAQAIVAMANRDGGVILVGIDENRSDQGGKEVAWPPQGITPKQWEDKLIQRCYEEISPIYLPDRQTIPIPVSDRVVVVIRVNAESAPRPLWHKQKGVRYRFGDENRPADLDTLRRLLQETGNRTQDKDFQAIANSVMAANSGDSWLGAVIQFPLPAVAFDSSVKRRLMEVVAHWFWVQPMDFRPAYQIDTVHGQLHMVLPRDLAHGHPPTFRIGFHAQGVLSIQSRTNANPSRRTMRVRNPPTDGPVDDGMGFEPQANCLDRWYAHAVSAGLEDPACRQIVLVADGSRWISEQSQPTSASRGRAG